MTYYSPYYSQTTPMYYYNPYSYSGYDGKSYQTTTVTLTSNSFNDDYYYNNQSNGSSGLRIGGKILGGLLKIGIRALPALINGDVSSIFSSF